MYVYQDDRFSAKFYSFVRFLIVFVLLRLFFLLFEMADASLATPMAIDDKQILIITISAVLLFLTVLGASLRFYGRLTVLRKLFAEDGRSSLDIAFGIQR